MDFRTRSVKRTALVKLPEPCVTEKVFVGFFYQKALADLLPLSDFRLALQFLKSLCRRALV